MPFHVVIKHRYIHPILLLSLLLLYTLYRCYAIIIPFLYNTILTLLTASTWERSHENVFSYCLLIFLFNLNTSPPYTLQFS